MKILALFGILAALLLLVPRAIDATAGGNDETKVAMTLGFDDTPTPVLLKDGHRDIGEATDAETMKPTTTYDEKDLERQRTAVFEIAYDTQHFCSTCRSEACMHMPNVDSYSLEKGRASTEPAFHDPTGDGD